MAPLGVEHPWLLLLAGLVPPLVWWLLRRRRPALRYSSVALVAGLPTGRAKFAKYGGAIGRGLAAFAVVLAMANPRTPDLKTPLPVEGVRIVFALDVSGSMATPLGPDPAVAPTPGSTAPTRLTAAKDTFGLFVAGGEKDGATFAGRPTDQIGLVTFAAVPDTPCPPTLNHSVLLKLLDEQQPKSGLDAGTNIGDALGEGLLRLGVQNPADTRRKVLVLLSDGEHNRGGEALRPFQAAHLAEHFKVPVYAVDCGGEGAGTPDEVKQRADGRAVLAGVAELTGGKSFAADTPGELADVFRRIDELEKQPIVSPRYRRYHDFGPWCGLAAVLLVAAVGLLERTAWRTLP